MRSKRTVAAACCVLALLAACGGGAKKVAARSKAPTAAGSPHTTAPQAPPGVPKVMLQSGTSYQNATLVRFCQGRSCHQGAGRLPRALAATDPLLFIVDTIPQSATVTITKVGLATPADSRALHVGSLMLYAPPVPSGSYLVQLNATWPGNATGSWQFNVTIPKQS